MNKNTAPRKSEEIKNIFSARGCTVKVERLGTSYRAGGEIFIFSPGIDPSSLDGFNFEPAGFEGFDGTGYDGRGRFYDVWLVAAGDYVPATAAEYENAAPERRIKFGVEHRSCSNVRRYVHRDELAKAGLNDLSAAFTALGL